MVSGQRRSPSPAGLAPNELLEAVARSAPVRIYAELTAFLADLAPCLNALL